MDLGRNLMGKHLLTCRQHHQPLVFPHWYDSSLSLSSFNRSGRLLIPSTHPHRYWPWTTLHVSWKLGLLHTPITPDSLLPHFQSYFISFTPSFYQNANCLRLPSRYAQETLFRARFCRPQAFQHK